jgi:hypothetical protein
MRRAEFALVALLIMCSSVTAFDWTLQGYVKDTPVYVGEVGGPWGGVLQDASWMNSTRSRLKARILPMESLTLALDYEIEGVYGKHVGTTSGYALAGDDDGLVDLSWKMVNRDRFVAHHKIDRLYAQYYSDHAIVTVGRQRVAWGVTSFFSPLDRFAPFAATAIDKDEKAGVDAVKISIPFGMLSNIEAIYSPTVDRDVYNAGVRLRTNIGGEDVGIMGGKFNDDWMLGMLFAGDVSEAALRTEITLLQGDKPAGYGLSERGTYLQAAISLEYGFKWRNLTLMGEGYYDGTGQSDRKDYPVSRFVTRRNLAQLYSAGTASLLLHPLVTLSLTGIINVNDGSWIANPLIEWSVTGNTSLRVGYQYARGSLHGEQYVGGSYWVWDEFALSPDIAYAILSWHF